MAKDKTDTPNMVAIVSFAAAVGTNPGFTCFAGDVFEPDHPAVRQIPGYFMPMGSTTAQIHARKVQLGIAGRG